MFVKDKEVPNSLCTPLKLFYHPMMALKNAYFKDGQEDVYKIREKALSIFKRKVKDSNLMFELREREFYKKPSAVRKEMKNKAKARNYWKKIKLMEEVSRNRGRKY